MRWQAVAPLSLGLVIVASHASAQPAPADSEPPDTQPTTTPAPAVPAEPTAPASGTVVTPAPTQAPVPPPADRSRLPDEGFRFGSYGRAVAGSDLRGGKPEKLLIVAHGPRIVEDSYLELEFSYGFVRPRASDGYIVLRPVVTLAFDGTLFHQTGEFDATPAIRNLYLDARLGKNITAWAGSRMYRGDDIYLFDFWPLDDQNTFGGGGQVAHPLDARNEVAVAAHVGFNRLEHPFQFQEIDVANPVQGATTVQQLNRQRIVASATGSYTMLPSGDGMGAKVRVHTEAHTLPAGTRRRDDGTFEALPADTGFLIGAEAGVFGFAPATSPYRRHLNLFARYSKGLAAFDELAPPTSFGPQLKTGRANELSFGLSGNFDHEVGQVMVGALSRRFIDADLAVEDSDDGWEYAVAARALARIVPDWFVGGEVSYQARFPKGLNPITLRADDPAMVQIAPMVAFSPMGPSSYDRPQLRLVYRAARLNQGALDLYVPDDPRNRNEWVHFLGIQAEWWFNSTRYR
jgi:LamB porin